MQFRVKKSYIFLHIPFFRDPSTKLFNREVGNLFKAGKLLRCDNLTLVMAYGEKRDIVQDDKTVHCVLASDWLLQQ